MLESADFDARLKELEVRVGALELKVSKDISRSATAAIEPAFHSLVAEWRATRGQHSRLDKLVLNSAYQRIIGLGKPAIPLLIKEMAERPSHWDWALKAITGEDPVPKDAWGDLAKIASAWVRWGKDNGLQW